jgi:cytochrome c biogenesis protein CcmG, thiol:disulfide interchange protein DsbE
VRRPVLLVALAVLVVVAAFSVLLATRQPVTDATSAPSPLLGHLAPSATGVALVPNLSAGVPVATDLARERGKIVVLNFWSSWCGPCKVEAPELTSFAWRERDRGVVVMGVVFNDSVAAAAAFDRYYGVSYQSIVDPGGVIANRFGVTSPPTTFVIDRRGRVAATLLGATSAAQLADVVARIS